MKNDLLISAAAKSRTPKPAREEPAPPPVAAPAPAPVQVQAPQVHVDMRGVAEQIADALRSTQPQAGARIVRWDFKVKRDLDGLIEGIQATPIYQA